MGHKMISNFLLISCRVFALPLFLLLANGQRLSACGGTPSPPICGKTMAFAKAPPPGPLLLTAGGTFMLPVVVYAQATAPCTSSPASVTISITLSCNPGPGAVGSLTTAVTSGYNSLMVPVTVPAGPPRICTVAGTATVTFSDGMMLRSTGDTVVCIVEPSPDEPNDPRLGLELLNPGPLIVHPGDQARIRYRLTNNDGNESFSGTLAAGIRNASVLPEDLGPGANGEGVYSLADPVGDHPPLFFGDDFPLDLCVPLPRDPHLTVPHEITRPILLAPGESMEVDVLTRHWGLCSSGTCSESTAVLDGTFSDNTPGIACSGIVVGVDTAVPPDFLWDGGGEVADATVPNPPGGHGRLTGHLPDGPLLDFDIFMQTLDVNGSPVFNGFDYMEVVGPNSLRAQFFLQGPFAGTDTIVGRSQFTLPDTPQVDIELIQLNLVSAAPIGFFDMAPFFISTYSLDLEPADGIPDGQLVTLTQVSLITFTGTSFNPPEPVDVFIDGFESGNVSRWSRSGSERGGAGFDGIQVFFDIRGFLREVPAPFPCPTGVTSDYNGDFQVTLDDFYILMEQFTQAAVAPFDRNGDGVIDIRDGVLLADRVGCQETTN